MNSETPIPPPPEEAPFKLPELNTTELDAAQVEQLLRDIEVCTQITEIIPKFAARGQVAEAASVTLAQARELLAGRAVRGLQLRYRYENADWWDTLMVLGDKCRLVRIRRRLIHRGKRNAYSNPMIDILVAHIKRGGRVYLRHNAHKKFIGLLQRGV